MRMVAATTAEVVCVEAEEAPKVVVVARDVVGFLRTEDEEDMLPGGGEVA